MGKKRASIPQAIASVPGLLYEPGFLPPDRADSLFRAVADEAEWGVEHIRLFGRAVRVPREVAWCGDAGTSYRYSGTDHRASCWLSSLEPVRDRLAAQHALDANFVLLNRYRDGRDHMGWHADDEAGMCSPVAAVSLGARRHLLVRPRSDSRSLRLELDHGSLLIIAPHLQHALPRVATAGERVSLTFRRIAP